MGASKALPLAWAAIIAAPFAAHAADLLPIAPPVEPPLLRSTVVPESSGWYLRGDVGVDATTTKTSWSQGLSDSEQNSTLVSRGFLRKEVGDSSFAGVGFGYKINSWFRADVTGEYHTGRSINGILGVSSTFVDGNGQNTFVGQNVYGGGRVSSFVALANGYIDLGTWNCITPYIGAGAGVSVNSVKGLAETGGSSLQYITAKGPGALGVVAASTIGDATKTSFAWAAMAGVSVDVTRNLKLDIGYRYLDAGQARTGQVYCDPNLCGATSPGIEIKHITSNEVKVGFRYMFGDAIESRPVVAARY